MKVPSVTACIQVPIDETNDDVDARANPRWRRGVNADGATGLTLMGRYGEPVMSAIDIARDLVSNASRVVVLSGAGISTASGIPDFRGPEGVWTKDPHAEMLSTFETWINERSVRVAAWRSRATRRDQHFEPNVAHYAINELARRGALSLLVTQNIDGLHHKARTPSELIVEIHGCSRDALCLRCAHREPIEPTLQRVLDGDEDPTCLQIVNGSVCGGMLKSATISFGQSLIASDLQRAQRAASNCDLFLAVGTTLAVYPVAGLVAIAANNAARVVIVNGAPTALDDLADVVVTGDISDVLGEVLSYSSGDSP